MDDVASDDGIAAMMTEAQALDAKFATLARMAPPTRDDPAFLLNLCRAMASVSGLDADNLLHLHRAFSDLKRQVEVALTAARH